MKVFKSKYKLKNTSGGYDTVYFETSSEQVIETENKKFVSKSEKDSWNNKANNNHSHDNVSSSNSGFMSVVDKSNLDKITNALGDYKLWIGTKLEYDKISQKDDNTIYFIKEI